MDSSFNLSDYLNKGIENIIKDAVKASFQNPKETAFIMKFMLESMKASKKRDSFEARDIHVPAFLIASITSSCNLFCRGCYARANKSCGEKVQKSQMTGEEWRKIFQQASEIGVSFVLLAGGEPLIRRDVIEKASEVKEIIFPIFTNGTMLEESYIKLLDRHRNLIPVLSLEGDKLQTDSRRGSGTYEILISAMDNLRAKGILYGASITVTRENIQSITDRAFLEELYGRGCKILFFIEYVPVDPYTAHLAPTDKERALLEQRQSELRKYYEDMIFISFPGDEKYSGGCLAAGRGFFHINSDGSVEPCPFSPYSDTSLKNCSLLEALKSPLFNKLKESELLVGDHDGGCVLFEKQEKVEGFLKESGR